MTPRLLVTVTPPGGRPRTHRAWQAWAGVNRVTWVDMRGVRSYVLLRHGHVVKIENV